MPFPLLRLPLLALREVIKSMGMLELLIFPFLSDECKQAVKASISKKSALEITFNAEKNFINFKIAPKFLHVDWPDQHPVYFFEIDDNLHLRVLISTCNRCVSLKWTRFEVDDDEELMREMLEHFADTYKPIVSFNFNMEIRQDFAMGLIRYCRQKHIRLSWIKFDYGDSASPEYVREILEGSIEEAAYISIKSSLPKGFKYTPPPGGLKLRRFEVSDAHWVNLNDFLHCELVIVSGDNSHMTPQYLNNLFKTIVSTECRIKRLLIFTTSIDQDNYLEIIEGLSDRALEPRGLPLCVKFEARNGRKTCILFHDHIIILQII